MNRANLLNTRTTDYLELIGNSKVYRVPPYQRDYSWTREQWEDLWSDILEVREGREDRHYLGSLVVEATTDREFAVIDGQQRLATLSLIALAVIAKLETLATDGIDADANRERSKELRNRFVGEKDPASLVEHSRLSLNATDDGFYQDFLVQLREPHKARGLPASNRQLWEAFRYFQERLDETRDVKEDGEGIARILSETVARGLVFILITVNDELNAYTVFETLNARGIELTTTDLLKNYLFSKVRVKPDLLMLQRRWQFLVATVEPRRFPDFLRYHLLCTHRSIRRRHMFKLVRSEIRNTHDVFALIDSIEPRGELFAALRDTAHEYWTESAEARRSVVELALFGARQMTPLLFSAWECLPRREFFRCLKLVSTITFRYSVVGKLHGARLEPSYHRAAKAVADGVVSSAQEVFNVLKNIYVEDLQFRQSFETLAITRSQKKLIRYVLARLESDASGRECDHESDPGTIEHILPQNPTEEWDDAFAERQQLSAVDRLGNLTLLEQAINRRIGNVDYGKKVVEYGRSRYALTREISELAPEEWTLPLLERRQVLMAKRATHLWRVDM